MHIFFEFSLAKSHRYFVKKAKTAKEGTGVCGNDAAGMFRANEPGKEGVSREPSRTDKKRS